MSLDLWIGEMPADENARGPALIELPDAPEAPTPRGADHINVMVCNISLYNSFFAWAGLPAFECDYDKPFAPFVFMPLTDQHLVAVATASLRPILPADPESEALYRKMLAWLEWWVAWALAHCERPVAYVNH